MLADLDQFVQADTKRGSGAPGDLTLAQLQVLAYVEHKDGPSQIAIARHLRVTRPTLVRTLNSLERKGLVTRTRSQPDRRIAHIALTDEGERVLRDYTAWREQRLGKLVKSLPAKTTTLLLRNLTALLAAQDDRGGG
jgi:DNA-binding MarR family transcriptional regulator